MLLLRKTTGYLGVLPTRWRGHGTPATRARHPWRGASCFFEVETLTESWKKREEVVLYKYRSIGDEKEETLDPYLLKLLDGELFLSDPKSFNDPFDGKFTFCAEGTDEEIAADMRRRGQSDEWIEKTLRTNTREQIQERFFTNYDRYFDVIRIFCLSTSATNKLMWSHYAEKHSGVCVGLEEVYINREPYLRIRPNQLNERIISTDSRLLPVLNVVYHESRPKPFNVLRDGAEDLRRFILTKSLDWSYECEVRVLAAKDALLKNPLKMPQEQIKEIVFGLRSPKILRERLLSLMKGKNIEMYEIIENERNYTLAKRQIAI